MRRFIIAFVGIAGVAFAAMNNSLTRPPGGSATGVPSANQSGLVPNPRAKGTSSNNVVTGNVGGGRHFRGVVPYGSTGYVQGSSTSSVDDFIRRSTNSRVTGSGGTTYQPYYDPRFAVGSDVRKQANGSNPQINPYAPRNLAQTKNTPFSLQPQKVTAPPSEVAELIKKQSTIAVNEADNKNDLNAMARDASKADKVDNTDKTNKKTDTTVDKNTEPLTNQDVSVEQQLFKDDSKTRFQMIREQILDDIRKKEIDSELARQAENKETKEDGRDGDPGKAQVDPEVRKEARSMLEEYKSFSNLAQAKASESIEAAMAFLKEGKYYKAADSFSQAAIWQPDNGVVYAGKSWSLFGAGEYMSSAYYLSRAIGLDTALAGRKINLGILAPDRDVFENRMIEISEWQQRSKSGELAFLLAYIYHQDNKPDKAKEMIDMARGQMSDDPAVAALSNVINGVTKPQEEPATPKGQ